MTLNKSFISDFWQKNKTHIVPALTLTKRCLENVIEMREKSNIIDYINLGFSFKDNFETAYNLKDPYTYFNTPNWKFITSNSMGLVVCNLVQNSMKNRVMPIASAESVAAFIGELEGIKFGWILYEDEADKLYVEKTAENSYVKVLEKIFWENYPSHHVVLGIQNEEEPTNRIYVKDDEKSKEYTPTALAQTYTEDIQDYLNHGICRSILFYGPPGSGKSNLVKNICFQLNLRTIRINNISQLSTDTISEVIRIFNPDAVILEDIDHVPSRDMDQLLDKIENFNKKHKLCFATANKLSKLDNAVIRPERFDQIKRIFQLEREIALKLVGYDEEIYQEVKDWPAASIIELMKRVKVKGKVHALVKANMQDLLDRIQKINNTNYDLKKKIDSEEEEESEEDYSEDLPMELEEAIRLQKRPIKHHP